MVKNSDEVWKDIEGFSNYEISNLGSIRSKTHKTLRKDSQRLMEIKGKLLKQRWNEASKCYFLDLLDDEKRRRTVYPHKETAKAFINNPDPSKTRIIHKDKNSRNNDADNLKWATPSEHMKWQFEVGNKNNYDIWKTRKKRYKNGFKPETVLPGRPKVTKSKK